MTKIIFYQTELYDDIHPNNTTLSAQHASPWQHWVKKNQQPLAVSSSQLEVERHDIANHLSDSIQMPC